MVFLYIVLAVTEDKLLFENIKVIDVGLIVEWECFAIKLDHNLGIR